MLESPITFNGLVMNDQSVRTPTRQMIGTCSITNGSNILTITAATYDPLGAFSGASIAALSQMIGFGIFLNVGDGMDPYIVVAAPSATTLQLDRVVTQSTQSDLAFEGWKNQPYFKIMEISGLDDPDVTYDAQKRSGATGEIPAKSQYGGRTISMTGQIRAWNLTQLRYYENILKKAFGDLEDHDFTYTPYNQVQRKLQARKSQKLDITDRQDGPSFWRNFTVAVRASDPIAVGPVTNSQDITSFGVVGRTRSYAAVADPALTIPAAPTGYWKLDETTGSFFDSSSGGNTLSLSGSLTRGAAGETTHYPGSTCIDFGSSGASVTIFRNLAVGSALNGSVWSSMARVYPSAWPSAGNRMTVISINNGAAGTRGWRMVVDSSGRFAIGFGNGSTQTFYVSNLYLNLNQWNTVGCSFDGTYLTFYVNGSWERLGPPGFTLAYAAPNASFIMYIGSVAGADVWRGKIDNTVVWGTAANTEQLYRNYLGMAGRRRTYPKTYPASASISAQVCTNNGNFKAWPTLRLYGPITNPIITNQTTGQSIKFTDLVIAAGSFIDIYTETGEIKWYGYQDTYAGLDIVNSDFFPLVPGDNTLKVTGDSYSVSSGAHLYVTWQDAYL